MRAKIQRWGNSLAVRLPPQVIEACQVVEGTNVDVRAVAGNILLVLHARDRRKAYHLDDLVTRMNRRNRPAIVDWGGPVGREIW